MNFCLFDSPNSLKRLFPLTMTRPVCDLRVGIRTIAEQWEDALGSEVGIYSDPMFSKNHSTDGVAVFIASNLLPGKALIDAIRSLETGQNLRSKDELLAYKGEQVPREAFDSNIENFGEAVAFSGELLKIERPWDIFKINHQALEAEFERLCSNKTSQELDPSNILIGPKDRLFIEPGARVLASVLNTETGPIYVGKDAQILENCAIRGPFAMLDHAVVKMSAKVYGATTLGPYVKVGGELNNVVFQSYSNKGHDGFLGNSVIGSWCNLGADTNCSNLKNNYGEVRAYSYYEDEMIPTGLQFCGLIMGDHSKSGINTMFNTGTVCGVSANVFDAGFPPKHISDFAWGNTGQVFRLEKAFEVASRMMERRGLELSDTDKLILSHIFENFRKEV